MSTVSLLVLMLAVQLTLNRGALGQETPLTFVEGTTSAGLWDPLLGMRAHANAWGDVNSDGWQDLFVGSFSDRPDTDYQVRGGTGPAPDRLMLGGPNGFSLDTTFPEMYGRTSGAAFADLDNDEDLDLVVARNYRAKPRGDAPTIVLRNDGGVLSHVTTLVTDIGARSIGVLDYDGDGLLDLFIEEDRFSGGMSVLLRNLGGLTFANSTTLAGLPTNLSGLGVSVADLTADGWPDLLVAGSIPPKTPALTQGARLFVNSGTGTFQEIDGSVFTWPSYGNEDDVAGVAVSDLNRDGLPDLVFGQHYGSTLSKGTRAPIRLFLHQGISPGGSPTFEDVTEAAGLPGVPTKAPHVEVADFDNDGWPDLLSTASAEGGARSAIFRHTGLQDEVPVFEQPGGFGAPQYWPTGATADVDRDGRLDIFLAEWEPSIPSLLLRNESSAGNWLTVGVEPRSVAIGSLVQVYRPGMLGLQEGLLAAREITASTGFGAGVVSVAALGLGDLLQVDVRVVLPRGGRVIDLPGTKAGQELVVSTLPPGPPVDLYILTNADSPDPVVVGQSVTYRIVGRNKSQTTGTGVTMLSSLPASVVIESATTNRGACGIFRSITTCNIGSLPPGASAEVTIVATTTQAGTIANGASVWGRDSDTVPTNNSKAQSTRVVGPGSVTLKPSPVAGCLPSTGTVKLTSAAPAGGVSVPLETTNSAASVPEQVTVPGLSTTAKFDVATTPVGVNQTGAVTASLGGVSKGANLTVRPIAPSAIALSPNPVTGGTAVDGTVTLECAAAPSDIVLTLSSTKTSVAKPTLAKVTVVQGTTSVPFTVTTNPVTSETSVTIKAKGNGITKSVVLIVKP